AAAIRQLLVTRTTGETRLWSTITYNGVIKCSYSQAAERFVQGMRSKRGFCHGRSAGSVAGSLALAAAAPVRPLGVVRSGLSILSSSLHVLPLTPISRPACLPNPRATRGLPLHCCDK